MKTINTYCKIVFLFFIFPIFIFGQSSISSEKALPTDEKAKKQNRTFIENSFHKNVIDAYQIQAKSLVNDFYSQLNLLSLSKDSTEQVEIKIAVLHNFLKPTIQVKNFFENTINNISIENFVKLAENSQTTFSISNVEYLAIGETYFLVRYFVHKQLGNTSIKQQITHKIYFFPIEKTFGNSKKKVWELKLGEFYEIQSN